MSEEQKGTKWESLWTKTLQNEQIEHMHNDVILCLLQQLPEYIA